MTIDAAMVGGILRMAPAFVWPMALAIPASLARIGHTLVALPHGTGWHALRL